MRFWKDSGIAVDLTAAGMRVEMGSLSTLFGGGVSFDIPEGLPLGEPVANKTEYHLFDDQRSIQDSVFTQHIDYVMFFKDSIRGLQPGAPVTRLPVLSEPRSPRFIRSSICLRISGSAPN